MQKSKNIPFHALDRITITKKSQNIRNPTFKEDSYKDAISFLQTKPSWREILSAYKKSQKPLGRNVAALVFCSENVITDLFTLTVDHDSAGDNRLAYWSIYLQQNY